MLKQASEEFEARGLVVKTASSRAELMEQFRNNQAQEGNTGKPEITVVNIQRFAEDRSKVDLPAYATNLQECLLLMKHIEDISREDVSWPTCLKQTRML
mgnify:CR=1 FL=1